MTITQANAKYYLKDYHGAVVAYTKVLELNPINADAYLGRGKAKSKIGDSHGAEQDFGQAVKLNPALGKLIPNFIKSNEINTSSNSVMQPTDGVNLQGIGSSNSIIQTVYTLQVEYLHKWRKKYSEKEYPYKVVINTIYESLQLEFMWDELLKCFSSNNQKIGNFQNAYNSITKLKNSVIPRVHNIVENTYKTRNSIGNLNLSELRNRVFEAQKGNNEQIAKIEQTYLWYAGGVELIYNWAAFGLMGLDMQQAAQKVCPIFINGINFKKIDAMQTMFGNSMNLEYKPLPKFYSQRSQGKIDEIEPTAKSNIDIGKENTIGDVISTTQCFTEVLQFNAGDPEVLLEYFNSGLAKDEMGDFSGAIQDYTKAIELDPKISFTFFNRGNSKGKLYDFSGAIQDYTKAIELDPENAIPIFNKGLARELYNRGDSKFSMGDFRGAIEDFDKAIELNPSNSSAYFSKGLAQARIGNDIGAIEDLDKGIELYPLDSGAYIARGLSKANIGEFIGAIEDYDRGIQLNPNDAYAYYNRAGSKSELEDYHLAIQDLDKAIQISPNFAEAYLNRGICKIKFSDNLGAIEDLDKTIELNPNIAQAYIIRGHFIFEHGDKYIGIRNLDKAIELNPEYAQAYVIRGRFKHTVGDNIGAFADYSMAKKLDPNLL